MQVDRPDPETYLAQALSSPQLPQELRPFYEAFQRFYQNRLWYQLTLTLSSFFALSSSAPFRTDLYASFVSSFANKLDPLKHAQLAVSVARTYESGVDAVAFLDGLLPGLSAPAPIPVKSMTKEGEEAKPSSSAEPLKPTAPTPKLDPDCRQPFVLLTMERAHFLLLLGQADETKDAMERCQKILEGLDSVEKSVNAAYYRVGGDYWKAKAEFADYYRHSLLYLACLDDPLTSLSPNEAQSRAHDLGISALLGSIYNFGELLQHPILSALEGTEGEVVGRLLGVFNRGDIRGFEGLVGEIAEKEPFLQQHFPFLREKICLLALIEAVFKRPTQDRTLPFSVISKEAQVPVEEVEHLVMKALALNLIRGTLDQVSSTASISWVQPRVLDRAQIDGLRARLGEWTDKVSATEMGAREGAGEMVVQ
ncbi:hypothetical protein JCM8547_003890 [Rhodosporidiobolus lusitaniae]